MKKTMTRRSIIQAAGISAVAGSLPFPVHAATATKTHRTLVLVELHGGNDGLNTVIPSQEPTYYQKRPNLSIPKKQQLTLSDELSLHPALGKFANLYEEGELCIVNGLGYEAPNRSHFRSIEIWDTASKSDEVLTNGWLTAGDFSQSTEFLANAIVFGRNAAPVLSAQQSVIVIDSIDKFYRQAKRLKAVSVPSSQSALAHLLRTQQETKHVADQLKLRLSNASIRLPEFKGGAFGRQLHEAAKLILLGQAAPVIKVSMSGFDTHQNQLASQNALLLQLSEGLGSFRSVLEAAGKWQDVLVMTYSEFGRRVAENGSGGTDHGTAAPHFVLGGALKPGVYGKYPSLEDLDRGDLKFTTHFKDYYQTVLQRWLGSSKTLSSQHLGFV